MKRIEYVEARHPYRLFVRFDDGTEGEDDLTPYLSGPVFEPLKDPDYFARVRLSDYGAPCWPNGVDVAPDAIYERLRGKSVSNDAANAG